MRRLLKLQHHHHTGKIIHHRHTSYRALLLVFVLAGAVLGYMGWSMQQIVHADSYYVYATVPAPIPTDPATIDTPTDGSVTTTPNIKVSGTCPITIPAVVVAIYNGASLLGSGPCATDGTYTALVSLAAGTNQLLPRTVTLTGDNGPDGSITSVTYTPPTPPPIQPVAPTTPTSNTTTVSTTEPQPNEAAANTPGHEPEPAPVLRNIQPVIIFGPDKTALLTNIVDGGTPPYTVNVDWGDNEHSVTKVDHAGDGYTLQHTYAEMVAHTIKVEVIDARNVRLVSSIAAATPYIKPSAIGSGTTNSPYTTGLSPIDLLLAYIAYVVLLCLIAIGWLQSHGYNYLILVSGRHLQFARTAGRQASAKRRRR